MTVPASFSSSHTIVCEKPVLTLRVNVSGVVVLEDAEAAVVSVFMGATAYSKRNNDLTVQSKGEYSK